MVSIAGVKPVPSAMQGSQPGGIALLITTSPAPGKYAFLGAQHYNISIIKAAQLVGLNTAQEYLSLIHI